MAQPIIGVLLLTLLGMTVTANAQSFSPFATYAVGQNHAPQHSVAADFNGDGKNDLAVTNISGNDFSVLLNKGDGIFYPAVDYPTDVRPGPIVADDFNGDGKKDVAIGNVQGGLFSTGTVSILSGNGDGTFKPAINYDANGATNLAAGDFNNDGKVDLAVTSSPFGENNNRLSLLINNGNGTYQPAVVLPTIANLGIKTGDLNKDGNLDLVVLDYYGSKCSLLLGNGNGTFQLATSYDITANAVVLSDVNGDTKLDVLLFYSSVITVLLGNGDGTFLSPVKYNTNSDSIGTPEVADFDGDGKLDIVGTGFYTAKMSVLRGRGDGTFHYPIEFPIGLNPSFLSVSDLNADGKPDISVVSSYYSVVRVYLNSPPNSPSVHSATFTATATITTNNIMVATFSDPDTSKPAGSFTALINWGDGTASTGGTILANGNGGFNVAGTYTYAKEGTYDVIVRIIDSNNNIASNISTATVADAPLTATGKTIGATYGVPFSGSVAGFTDADTTGNAGEFSATINWGDGTISAGLVSANSTGGFDVIGTHTYNSVEAFSTTINITAQAGSTASANGLANVAKANQSITFAMLSNKTYGESPFTLSAVSSSGLPASFQIVSGPASINANTLTINGAGIVVVRATQVGNANYNAAPNIDRTFMVNKATPTITWNRPVNIVYGTTLDIAQLNATASVPGTLTYTPAAGTVLNAGSDQSISVNFIPSDTGNYNSASKTVQLNVLKAQATMNLSGLTQTYSGDPKSATVTTTPANLTGVSVSYAQNGVPAAFPSNAGSYDVFATLNNTNYQASNAVGTLVIEKATQTITLNSLPDKTYGDAAFNVTVSSTSNLPVSFSIVSGPATVSGKTVALTGTGTVTVRASQAGNNNYNAAPNVEQTFTVSKATGTINLSGLVQTYNGTSKSPTVTTNPSGFNVVFSYSQNGSPVSSPINVGAYNVTATINNPNYQGSTSGVLVINKATPVIFWNNPANIIIGTALSGTQLNATTNVPGTFQYTPPAGTVLPLGTSQLSVTLTPADTANYTNATKSVQLTVDPVPPPALRFSSATYNVNEGAGNSTVTVNRIGDSSPAITINYTTSDSSGATPCNTFNGLASSLCDYAPKTGILQFAAGETSKTISIPVVDDGLVEGIERFSIALSNPKGGAILGQISTATISIADNELTGVPTPIKLLLDESGPDPDQAAAIDSMLFLRDPFPVINAANKLNQLQDPNTRIIVFVTNLQLTQGESSSSVIVNLMRSNNQSYEIPAEAVQSTPFYNLTQVIFRLPDNLPPGTYILKVKTHVQESNSGTIRIGN
jgi:hypothetical protein